MTPHLGILQHLKIYQIVVAAVLRVAGGTAGLVESNGSLPSGL